MKKTFPANISGKIYYIDEDAYMLLQNYFTQLRNSFPGDEGREIVDDIEGRVAEIFEDKMVGGSSVVTLADVNEVIERMGRPEELSDEEGAPSGAGDDETVEEKPFISINLPTKKRLYRDTRNKVFGGVVSGVARYLNWDCNIMRLLLVVIALCTYVLPLCVAYLVLWMIIPPAGTSRQILEMQGRPVTVDSVGRTVLDTATPPPYNAASEAGAPASGGGFWSFVSMMFRVLGKCAMILLLVVSAVAGVTAVVFFLLGVSALVMGSCYGAYEVASNMGFDLIHPLLEYELWSMILGALVGLIPCVALVWAACSSLFNVRGASTGLIIAAVVTEVLLIAALVVMMNLTFGTQYMCLVSGAAALQGFMA